VDGEGVNRKNEEDGEAAVTHWLRALVEFSFAM